jgi:hypothetical protein
MGVERVVLSPGDGKNFPKEKDTVVVHYVGTLKANGKQYANGTPVLCSATMLTLDPPEGSTRLATAVARS